MASLLVCLSSARGHLSAIVVFPYVEMIYGITEEVVVSSPVDIETRVESLDLCCCRLGRAGMVHSATEQ